MLRELGGRTRAGFYVSLVACCALGVGCQWGKKAEGENLESRVRAYWGAKVAGDDVRAYEFEDLAVTGKMSRNQYVRGRSPMLRYQDYEIKSIEKEGKEAKVKVTVRYEFRYPTFPPMASSMVLTDTWQLHDGVWYRHFEHHGPGGRKRLG